MRKLLTLIVLAGCATTTAVAPLRTSPSRVYKLADPGREGTESCTFMLVLPENGVPVSAEVATLAGTRELERRILTDDGLQGMNIQAGTRSVIRLHVRRPAGDAFDRVRGTVELKGGAVASFDVPVTHYTPKTKLIFPFRGPGMISAGGVNDGGHRNNSGQFAIDVLALTEHYGPMTCGEDRNECSAGFGRREIVAPADGVVVMAWSDIADNVSWENADRALFTRSDGTVVDTGNSVVLDHQNGEFSVIAHMQQGSVTVTQGQRVRQGEKLGLLGNSGESYGPHLHYQLQDGPDLNRANGLPLRFEGGPSRLVRGAYFNAK
jgi:Peptidase family M23